MSISNGGHLIRPKTLQPAARKTVYPLPQELAEKVIKDRGRNAYVVVFDTDSSTKSSSSKKNVLKTLNDPNACVKQIKPNPQKTIKGKHVSGEDVKINFSNLEFEDYDSSKTAVKVFSDEENDGEVEKCTSVAKGQEDEGYEETENEDSQQHQPIAGYMVIPPTLSTPLSKYDLSASSGYFSGESSRFEFSTPSPIPTEHGLHHPAARQIILMPSSMTYDGRPVMPHTFSTISPMSSLAAGLNNVARIQSPSTFSTTKFTGADAFSLPEHSTTQESQHKLQNENHENHTIASVNSTRVETAPFKWEQVENRIVIQAPNKKPMDVTLPEIVKQKEDIQSNHQNKRQSQNTKPNVHKIGDVVLHCDVKQKETVVMVQHGNSNTYAIGHLPVSSSSESPPIAIDTQKQCEPTLPPVCKVEVEDSNSQGFMCTTESQETNDLPCSQETYGKQVKSDKELLDTSLTNIQWLGGIQLRNPPKADRPESSKPNQNSTPIQWKRMSTDDIYRIASECGKAKRPPFSYMTLIQMALHSKEDRRMRLRDICAWIENTFLYYKHTAKPGWRNSIRHNLSLYSIFERETTKKHGSYWTVRDDCPEKLKSCPGKEIKKDDKVGSPSPFSGMIPVLPSYAPHSTATTTCPGTQPKKRVGPQPILPRPSPVTSSSLQTYALIPIQGVNSSQQSLSMPLSSSQESTSSESSQCDKKSKTRKIAPKLSPSLLLSPPNLLKQAWVDSHFVSSSETEGEQAKANSDGNKSDNETCAKKLKTGLPQPKIYTKNTQPVRKVKSRRKQKLIPKERELMQDSSDEETEYAKFVSKLEEDFPTPVRKLLNDEGKDEENSAITSTPLKNSGFSSKLPSPFSGLTPLKTENILDSSLFECLRDSPQMAVLKRSPSSSSSPKLDLNFIGLTPVKGNHDNSYNLSKFLAEYPIDANMMDEADILPVDLSALNWSAVQNLDPS